MAVAKGEPEKAMKAAVAATRAETNMAIDNEVVRANKPLLSLPISVLPGLCGSQRWKSQTPRPEVSLAVRWSTTSTGWTRRRNVPKLRRGLLSKQIGCPVWLIYNDTHGWGSDLVEAAYDRAWPFLPQPPGFALQANKTTRQVGQFAVPGAGAGLDRLALPRLPDRP